MTWFSYRTELGNCIVVEMILVNLKLQNIQMEPEKKSSVTILHRYLNTNILQM